MKVICFGDSNTWGYDPRGYFGGRYDEPWPELLPWDTVNCGENGREIPRGSVKFPEDTDLLVIMLGTNDLLQGNTPETVAKRMEAFLSGLNLERSGILLIAPPPMKLGQWVPSQSLVEASLALTEQFRTLSESLGVPFAEAGAWNIPLAFDGVHFTQEGHRAFARGLIEHRNKGE